MQREKKTTQVERLEGEACGSAATSHRLESWGSIRHLSHKTRHDRNESKSPRQLNVRLRGNARGRQIPIESVMAIGRGMCSCRFELMKFDYLIASGNGIGALQLW